MMYAATYENVKYKMKMFVTAVCFLFLLKLKWPKDKSIEDHQLFARVTAHRWLSWLCIEMSRRVWPECSRLPDSRENEKNSVSKARGGLGRGEPKAKASSRGSYIYSLEPRDDAFCLELNFNISKVSYCASKQVLTNGAPSKYRGLGTSAKLQYFNRAPF